MRMTSCLQAELSCDLRARRRMVGQRGESGWDYAYAVKAREPSCVVVTRERSDAWSADRTRRRRLELPMPSLAGEWSFGPEGLRRGC